MCCQRKPKALGVERVNCLASFPSAPCPWPVASQLEGHCSREPLGTLPGGLCPDALHRSWCAASPGSPSVLGAHGWARACLPDPLQGAPWAEALPLWFRCDLTCPLGLSETLPPILLSARPRGHRCWPGWGNQRWSSCRPGDQEAQGWRKPF